MATPLEMLGVALPVVVGLSLMALASIVVRHAEGARHNLFFSALFFLSGIKSISEGLDSVADGFHRSSPLFPDTLYWQLQAAFCALAMLPLIFLFAASFPRPVAWMVKAPWLAALAFLPSLGMGALLVLVLTDATWYDAYSAGLNAYNVLGTGLTLCALLLLLRTRSQSKSKIERTQAGFVAIGFLPAFVAGWVITGLQVGPSLGVVSQTLTDAWTDAIIHYLSPLFEFLSASLVGFAILKYNILGISPKFRLGVKSFAVGFMLVCVFLFVQFVENRILQGQVFNFAGEYGSFLLSGVTGLVLFKPIEMFSGKVSNTLLPKDAEPLGRAAEIYEAQCTYVLRDAQVTEREMSVLRNLRAQLGLSEAQARAVEEKVERRLQVDSPMTGASAGTATRHVAQAAADVGASAPVVHRASPLPPAKSAAPAAPAARKAPAKPAVGKPASKPATKPSAPKKAADKPPAKRQ